MESTDEAVQRIRAYFDETVDDEWQRLAGTPADRVAFHVHRHFLSGYLPRGSRVLEVGAGPGRFTRELVALGANVTVTDISEPQLEANRHRAQDDGYADSVSEWLTMDVRDTSRFEAHSFDVVLAFGGPLSYVFDDAQHALTGLLRITRPTGAVIASVMSLLGAWRHFLPGVQDFTDEQNEHVLATGDLRIAQPDGHVCKLYRASELRELVERCGATVLDLSASNWASLEHPEVLADIEADPMRWQRFLEHEVAACREPGAVDGGTHLLFACR